METASNTAVIEQLSQMLLCPSLNIDMIQNVVIAGLTLAYTPETHPCLVQCGLIWTLLRCHTRFLKELNLGADVNHLK